MYQLKFKNGLLYADITIVHEDKTIYINDVIIDTGASHSIILSDFLYESDIGFDDNDPKNRINGLISLDFLRAAKIIIDLDAMAIDLPLMTVR